MKVTNSLQIQTTPVQSTYENNLKKSEQSHVTEAYVKDSVQTANLLYNYTSNEVGVKSNVNLVKALAEKSVRDDKRLDRERLNYELNKLYTQSPDQNTLHKPVMPAVIKLKPEETRPLGEMTLLNYLIEHDDIQIKTNTIIKTTKSFPVYL